MSGPTDMDRQFQEQRAQAEKFMRDLAEIGSSEAINTWFPPPELAHVIFFRCGRKHTDGSMPPHVARIYHKHRAMGAKDAPPDMRPPLGFESDGKLGVYVWFHPEVWGMLQEAKRAVAHRRPTAADVMQRDLGPGVELTVSRGYDKPGRVGKR